MCSNSSAKLEGVIDGKSGGDDSVDPTCIGWREGERPRCHREISLRRLNMMYKISINLQNQKLQGIE